MKLAFAAKGQGLRWLTLSFAVAAVAAACVIAAVSLSGGTLPRPLGIGTTGWDTYRQLDKLPYLPAGVTAMQRSSSDPTGGNADNHHVLAMTADGALLAQHQGPGEIDSIWTTTDNLARTGNLKIVLDGTTVLDAPLTKIVSGALGAPFVYPLVADDTQSSGGYYIKVPMSFRQSMQVSTTEDPDYYHVTFRTFTDAAGISTFNASDPARDVLTTLQEAGAADPKPAEPGAVTRHGTFQIMPGQAAAIAQASGSGQVTGLQLRIPRLAHPAATPLTDDGRAFGADGSSSFTVRLNPANTGIQVTRRYDPMIGHQKASLLVDGNPAGHWAPAAAVPAGSWADETVTVPAARTAGKSQVTISNVFVSSDGDFNEFSYTVTERVGSVWQAADTVDVGPDHTAAEAAHHYTITRETWSGVRTYSYPLPGPVTDTGRAFGARGGSSFIMIIDPHNDGVRLTRRFDPEIGRQVAAVAVNGTAVGTWAPNATQPGTWADESIELPASVTAGKSKITVSARFVSSAQDFNEFTYWADSHVASGLERTDTLNVGNAASESAHGYAITGQTWAGARTFAYPDNDQALTSDRIQITCDGKRTVDAPLGQFFGSPFGEFDTRSLMTAVDVRPDGWLTSWWPMPYGSSVTVSLVNGSGLPLSGEIALTTAASPHWRADLASGAAGYFHATYHSGPATPGRDWTILSATGHGKVVGVVLGMRGAVGRGYLEGDEHVYTDGSRSPQISGTGTEDFFEGGWYFSHGPFTAPLNGNPSHEAGSGDCPAGTDCTGAYRLLIGDAIPFNSSIAFGIEHGGINEAPAEYASTAFWYGQDT